MTYVFVCAQMLHRNTSYVNISWKQYTYSRISCLGLQRQSKLHFYAIFQYYLYWLHVFLFGEYWNYFSMQFVGIHAFGYNSADSEPIWIKSEALWVHCWGLALADIWHDPRSSDSLRGRRNFVFLCPWFHRFSGRQFCRHALSEQNFKNFSARGRFIKKKNKNS